MDVKKLVRPLLPYRMRMVIRGWLDHRTVRPEDVQGVKVVTSEQWRTLSQRSPRYLETYWADADVAESLAKRRSAWLAEHPSFGNVESVLELGCGAGRNLYVIQQRYPRLALFGVDINPQAIDHARRHVRGVFTVGDIYGLDALLDDVRVDLIFTMGVLIHLHPATLPELVRTMGRRARKYLLFVEELSPTGQLVKGPARWRPREKITGDYIQWSPNLPAVLDGLGLRYRRSRLPDAVQANGARELIVVDL